MTLFEQWNELVDKERDQQELNDFWQDYYLKEKDVYAKILSQKTKGKTIKGVFSELAKKYGMDNKEFVGFLEGVNTSLKAENDLEALSEDTELDSKIDVEKLYYNMLSAKAQWLYELEEWDNILTPEKRKEITKKFKTDGIVVNENKTGRNDACPCGSGKKYKKCCGK